MARPLDENKRNAILAATTALIAERGLGASTAEIAKLAQIPHGSVFTYFGTKVEVKMSGNGKGKITIPFNSEADFNRIIKLING